MKMIDIHTHILPGVDDGAESMDEAVAMCQASAADGVAIMVATPHAFDSVHKTHDPKALQEIVDELNSRLGGRPRVVLGCELRLTHDVVNQICVDKTAPTIADGPYVLLELPHYLVPAGTDRALFELMNNQIKPIIAHPERNRSLMAEPHRFYPLIEMGVLGQVDAGSVTGQFGEKVQRTARTMLENGLIHLIASDCHNMRNRVPGLSSAVSMVADIIGVEGANRIATSNPASVITGDALDWKPPLVEPVKRKKWLFF
ncbi:MAG TPA: CpsB/CapC family capsule biosynthesis tyrosine phosphatase [Blastocatellia bacterium]|nr:CpsB/CapC family capsule biosynthesis tyrosine phosphatase [Blastocatellia bacterium]